MTKPTSAAPISSPRVLGPLSRQVLIRASAGTGKTFQLSTRYLALVRISSPDRILASTFTRKAAGEILERVLLRLADAVLAPAKREELAKFLGPPQLTAEECRRLLGELTRQLHRIRIGTLDSFNAQLAGSYSLELGFPPGWSILDPGDLSGLRSRAIAELLDSSHMSEVTQLTHLLDHGGPSLSVSSRIARAVDELYQVFLESTESCWTRPPPNGLLSAERIEELLNQIEQFPAEGSQAKARGEDCARFRSSDWDKFLKTGLPKAILGGTGVFNRKPIPDGLQGLYRSLIGHVGALQLTIWHQQTAAAFQLLAHFRSHLDRLQFRERALGFDDVTRGLSRRPADAEFSFRLNSSLSHLLLDEFQDTSPAQWNVLRPLAESALQRPDGTFFCVGDSKQAIYGWRGGEAAIFDAIERDFAGINVLPLDRSFRSSPVIMEFVNRAMTGLTAHTEFDDATLVLNDWCRDFPVHTTARSELPGYVCLRTTSEPTRARPGGDDDEPTGGDHFREVAEYVRDLVALAPAASVGILTRRNETVRSLIFELHRLGLPASEEGGNPLTDSAAVRALLAVLTLADHPGNTIARYHIAESPFGERDEFAGVRTTNGAHRIAARLRLDLGDRGYAACIRRHAEWIATACDAREARRLSQLIALAEDYDQSGPTLRPTDFVEFVRQQRRQEPTDARVRVMTVHQAKGLEFDTVVLPELDVQILQMSNCKYVSRSSRPGGPPDLVALYRNKELFDLAGGDLAEARAQTVNKLIREALCLLYVSLTRPVHSLHLLLKVHTSAKLPKTYAGLLRAALGVADSMSPNALLFEMGNANWFREVAWPESPSTSHTRNESELHPAPELRFAPSDAPRRPSRVQPSRMHHATVTGMDDVLVDNSAALSRGTLVHRWMESIHWIDKSLPTAEELQRLARGAIADPGQLTAEVSSFLRLFASPEIRRLFDKTVATDRLLRLASGRGADAPVVEVRNEWPFTRARDGALVNGSIDRLILFRSCERVLAAEIIDFKTDFIDPQHSPLAARVAHHRPQLSAYREAVADFFDLESSQVSASLLFLSVGEVVDVS